MAVSVERVPNEPIVIVTYKDPPEPPVKQAKDTSEQIATLVKDVQGPVWRINDIRAYNLTFAEMTAGLAEEARAGLEWSISDPRLRNITVGSTELVKLGSEAVKQEQYGSIEIIVYTTLEEAFEHARREIAGK